MPGLLNLVDAKSRVNYDQLVKYISSCPIDTFNEQAVHPFLVGKELYEGELRQRADATTSTKTMKFSAASFRQHLREKVGSEISPKTVVKHNVNADAQAGMSRAIYMLRKNIYSYEDNSNIITIGRRSDNDIVIADYVVSKLHTQIIIFRNMYFIVDLDSTNGTMVNNRPLAPNMKVQLNINSTVAFGRLCFVFTSPINLYRGLRREILGI